MKNLSIKLPENLFHDDFFANKPWIGFIVFHLRETFISAVAYTLPESDDNLLESDDLFRMRIISQRNYETQIPAANF
jgi:hypothetical protein